MASVHPFIVEAPTGPRQERSLIATTMIGTTISHYTILEKLGEGGMGVVYKARDTRLDRAVALKFLTPASAAGAAQRERFLQEAKAVAQLSHPNICVIHGIGEHESVGFIDMEFVDGMTLREKLGEKPFSVQEAVAWAVQIGQALDEAHAHGIVHRDVKPENIMVTAKNQVKVMDFGLAKLKGSLRLTRSTATVGTLGYMAPEQIQGGEADARSDIFSLGVVLYELLTGRSPFRGEHEAAIMYSIVNEDPPPIARSVSDAPPDLQPILPRALQKDPEHRYQTMHDLLSDLQGLERGAVHAATRASGTTTLPASRQTGAKSLTINLPELGWRFALWLALLLTAVGVGIVVYQLLISPAAEPARLPIAVADFVNETNEPELDGLSGMLITSLEQSKRLSVVTRVRMFDILRQLGHGDAEQIDESLARQVCRQAGVPNLVTASIRKFGKLYTIDLKILDPDREEYLVALNEQGEGHESIPGMLDKLSEKTRLGLKERTADVRASQQQIALVTTQNLEAYKRYFKGEELFGKRGNMQLAVEQFQQAVRLDTTFALAYYRLASAHEQYDPALARAYVARAVALKDRLPEKELLLARALEQRLGGNYERGLEILKSVEQRYPDDKQLLFEIGHLSFFSAKLDQAERYYQKVLTLDPAFTYALSFLANTYGRQRAFDKMKSTAERYVELSGGSFEAYNYLAQAYAGLGDTEVGLWILTKTRELFPGKSAVTLSIIELLQLQGEYARAEQEVRALMSRGGKAGPAEQRSSVDSDWSSAMNQLVSIYYYTGRYREALQALDQLSRFYLDGRDTSLAALARLERAYLLHFGMGDVDGAWAEARKSVRYGSVRGSVTAMWRLALAALTAYRGDAVLADSLSSGVRHFSEYCRMLLAFTNGDLAEEAALGDSILKTAPGTYELLIWNDLAQARYAMGQPDRALEALRQIQSTRRNDYRRRAFHYPRSLVLQGKIYEQKGDIGLAQQSYERFLDLWKKSDTDIPLLAEARTHLASVRRPTSPAPR